ncbi:MAG TPA: TrmH family RNA methyltransferase [Candidatus Saccharimonadales bacterium]|nr:TrmH family RNA methyltransferase [Candidatus Saccharimonadales bacterium]
MTTCLLLNNIRSTHNVGSLIRTADGFGVAEVICSGYTPYPAIEADSRLPHIRRKLTAQIHKTALGAEDTVPVTYTEDALEVVEKFKNKGFLIVGLEQSERSQQLGKFRTERDTLLLLGEEVDGLNQSLIAVCDVILEIPMHGKKESFNVSIAGAIALYQLSLA